MTGHQPDASLSDEARTFLAALVPDTAPVDFSRIAEIRVETHEDYRPGAERAQERHRLTMTEVEIAGVTCTRVRSEAGIDRGRLLYLFGGAFIVGDPVSDLPIIGALAEFCRVEVVAPRYRLAPEDPAPAGADDCAAVYRELAIRSDRLLVAGESAGGNLALLTAQRARDEGLPLPAALALLSPAVDLRVDPELFAAAAADPTLNVQRAIDAGSAYAPDGGLDRPEVSPILGSMAGLPPTIITTGTRDLLVGMCVRLDRKMRRAGVDVECRVWDGLWHVFEFYDEYPEAAESLAEIAAFLDDH